MTATEAPASAPETDLDLFSDEVLYDPFPHYKALRDLGPVVYLTKYGMYGLFRYDRVRAALRDWQTFSSAPGIAFNAAVNEQISGQSILAMDPPQHTAVRKVFDDSLRPKFIRHVAGDIAQRAGELVDEVAARKEFDGVRDFARRLPVDITVAFDIGVHTCPGRTLSAMEGEALLGALARRVSRIELAGEPTRTVNNITRGLDTLPLRVS